MTYEEIKQVVDTNGVDTTYLIHCFDTKDDGSPKPTQRVHDCKITSLTKKPYQTICFTGKNFNNEVLRYVWGFDGIVSIQVQQKEWWKQ